MYESPIRLTIETIATELASKVDETIGRAIYKVLPQVDKDELIKALAYDRNQYDKGYEDGYEAGLQYAKCPHYNIELGFCEYVGMYVESEGQEEDGE